jgi:hypothetical protein
MDTHASVSEPVVCMLGRCEQGVGRTPCAPCMCATAHPGVGPHRSSGVGLLMRRGAHCRGTQGVGSLRPHLGWGRVGASSSSWETSRATASTTQALGPAPSSSLRAPLSVSETPELEAARLAGCSETSGPPPVGEGAAWRGLRGAPACGPSPLLTSTPRAPPPPPPGALPRGSRPTPLLEPTDGALPPASKGPSA